jgi:hypothetical protein
VKEKNDPFINLADRAMEQFSQSTTPCRYAVDILPACTSFLFFWLISLLISTLIVKYIPSWMPGAGFKKTAKFYKETLYEFVNKPHDMVKERMVRLQCYIFISLSFQPSRMLERRHIRSHLRSLKRVTSTMKKNTKSNGLPIVCTQVSRF